MVSGACTLSSTLLNTRFKFLFWKVLPGLQNRHPNSNDQANTCSKPACDHTGLPALISVCGTGRLSQQHWSVVTDSHPPPSPIMKKSGLSWY